MSARAFTVEEPEEGQRIDVLLARRLGASRSSAAGRIARGEVRVDGEVVAKSYRTTAGQRVTVAAPPPQPTGAAGVAPPPVRYEDGDVLVVAKPPGMVVHPGTGNPAGTLVQALQAGGYDLAPAGGEGRPGVVHRLDRGTSGLLVLARTDRAHAALVAALRRREVGRGYVALAEGTPPAPRGRIEVPVARDPANPTRFTGAAGGRHAVTHWRVLGEGRLPPGSGPAAGHAVSLLRLDLETGRTHQIRVHLAHAGHPVVGDPDYGASRALAAALGLDRPFLHAAWLRFRHPVTGVEVRLHEPLPADLRGALRMVGIPEPGEGAGT